MSLPLIVIIGSQLLFTISDLMARNYMPELGFELSTFISTWFFVYILVRTFATFGQLYVFTTIELGKTMALFGATSIVVANVLGFFILNEILSTAEYLGVILAIIAFLVIAFS